MFHWVHFINTYVCYRHASFLIVREEYEHIYLDVFMNVSCMTSKLYKLQDL